MDAINYRDDDIYFSVDGAFAHSMCRQGKLLHYFAIDNCRSYCRQRCNTSLRKRQTFQKPFIFSHYKNVDNKGRRKGKGARGQA